MSLGPGITEPNTRRPDGVTILSISAILGSVTLLFAGTALRLGVGTSSSISPVAIAILILIAFGYAGVGQLVYGMTPFVTIILIMAMLYLAAGIGSFGGRRWAWTLDITISFIGIVLNIIQIVETGYFYYSVPGLLVTLLVLYYLMRPYVRNFYRKEHGTPAWSTP